MIAVEEDRLKGLLKTVLVEVLEERQDLLRKALQESLEDMSMIRAIRDWEKSSLTSRKKVTHNLFVAVRRPRTYG